MTPNDQVQPTPEEIAELTEETRTVADEILEEVKQCRTEQVQLMADLTRLSEEGRANSLAYQELLTELKNSREESRNLQAELKALLESRSPQQSPSGSNPSVNSESPVPSIPSTSETMVTEVPVSVVEEAPISRKRKRVVL